MRTCVISLSLMLSLLPHLILSSNQLPPDVAISRATCKGHRTKNRLTIRNILLSNFTSDTEIEFDYYTSSDTVYAQGLCRADVEPETCRSCFNDAKTSLPKACKFQKDAFGYYDLCTFHYSSSLMQGKYLDPSFSYSCNTSEDAKSYTKVLNDLRKNLKGQASGGREDYKVAVGSQTSSQSETVYGLAQCMPDLSKKNCEDCLQNAIWQSHVVV